MASASSETAGARTVMGPYALLWFYRRRLRVHAVQELLAGLGVAIAVALVLATLVAAGSVSGSARQVVDTVIGPASLQLHARSQQGMPQHLLASVEELPAVAHAAPLLEQSATLSGPRDSRVSIDLAGADASLVLLDGLGHTLPRQTLQAGGIGLSARTAAALGIARGSLGYQGRGAEAHVLLTLAGRTLRLPVSAVLGQEAFGALSHALVAVMPLQELQSVAGLAHRISRILVQPRPHRTVQARAQLSRLAAGRLDVAAADQDVGLLSQALRPSKQANAFFATVSAMLGVLLAFDALLLTVPERRRSIADLRLVGMRPSAIVQMLLFQALVLGVLATIVGLAAGYLLSMHAFAQSTHYLAEAFTLSGGTVVGVKPVLLAAASGICAACLASTMPLLDLRRGRAIDLVYRDREPPEGLPPRIRRPIALACLALLAAAGTLFGTSPSQALIACALLAATAMLLVPLALATVIALVRRFATRFERFAILPVALSSLRSTALRSLALAGTGAIALFGSVALGGARSDLTRGIESFAHSYSADAGIWIGNPADNQAVVPFAAGDLQRRIAALPGVKSVQSFLGGFLQLDGRRVWVLARPKGYERHVLASQIEGGSLASALARIGSGNFVAVSKQTPAAGARPDRRHDHAPDTERACAHAGRGEHDQPRMEPRGDLHRQRHIPQAVARLRAHRARGRACARSARADGDTGNQAPAGSALQRATGAHRPPARSKHRRIDQRRARPARGDIDVAADRGDPRARGRAHLGHLAKAHSACRISPLWRKATPAAPDPAARVDGDTRRRVHHRHAGRRMRPARNRRLSLARHRLPGCAIQREPAPARDPRDRRGRNAYDRLDPRLGRLPRIPYGRLR